MLIPQFPVVRVSASTVTRMLEQKRAVEHLSVEGSAVARLNLAHKYADIFADMITSHQSPSPASQEPTFPIEVCHPRPLRTGYQADH